MTIVCGDSHTSTHGAFGSLAFGIGTSEVEHVLATQCMVQHKPRSMRIRYEGELGFGVTAKDLILATLGQMGVGGLTGPRRRVRGPGDRGAQHGGPHDRLQHDHRGRRPRRDDRPRREDLRVVHRRGAPGRSKGRRACRRRSRAGASCRTDEGAEFDTEVVIDASAISPQVTWGTNPGMVRPVTESVPDPEQMESPADREEAERALHYMALEPGTPIEEISVDRVFIGSCTNSRIGDLRAAAEVIAGRTVADTRQRDGRPRIPAGEGAGRGRGP